MIRGLIRPRQSVATPHNTGALPRGLVHGSVGPSGWHYDCLACRLYLGCGPADCMANAVRMIAVDANCRTPCEKEFALQQAVTTPLCRLIV